MGGGQNQSSNAYPSQQGYGTYQGRPNPNAQGYRPNQQAYVPPPFVKNDDIAHAPRNNVVGSQAFIPPSSSSNSQQDMMYQFMSNLMEKINGFEESLKKQENVTTLVSQMLNTKAEQDTKKGGLPSNVVINPQNLHAMNVRSGRCNILIIFLSIK